MNIQVIERNGNPEWAIIPYKDYLRLVEVSWFSVKWKKDHR